MRHIAVAALLLAGATAHAQAESFAGRWHVDLRTPSERAKNADCGIATFDLTQEQDRISGDHSMAPVGCGRVNEGGPETVRGVVVKGVAVLVVTSGRNGAMVLGTATLNGKNRLRWQYLEDLRPGDLEGDSPLILNSAVLVREKSKR